MVPVHHREDRLLVLWHDMTFKGMALVWRLTLQNYMTLFIVINYIFRSINRKMLQSQSTAVSCKIQTATPASTVARRLRVLGFSIQLQDF